MRHRAVVTILMFTTAAAILVLPARAQQKPFTEDQVQGLVRAGLGDESGAKLVGQRGIEFAPTEEFLRSLKAAGANKAFLQAVRAAKPPQPRNEAAKKPLNQVQVLFALLAGQVPSHRVAMLVKELGIDFEPKDDYLAEVRLAGGDKELISALKNAKVEKKPQAVEPGSSARDAEQRSAETKQAELKRHATQGAEFFQKSQYAAAETEYRAAVQLDPQNSDLHVALSRALNRQRKLDEALTEAREGVRLNSGSDMAHLSLATVLSVRNDLDGAGAEFREVLRLNPKSEDGHIGLGAILEGQSQPDGAMAEYREALRLNPNSELAHLDLGLALGRREDLDGASAEFREVLRLDPRNEDAHIGFGAILEGQGHPDRAMAEYREALRLNPNSELAHLDLGLALAHREDLDGAMVEFHEALRIRPDSSMAHYSLGVALEKRGDRQGALQEYRTACDLNPQMPQFRQAYERLLQQASQ